MVQNIFYLGGLIVLPYPSIKALYLIDKMAKYKKEKQLHYLEKYLSFECVDNELNELRREFLSINNLPYPQNSKEALGLLIYTKAIIFKNDRFVVNNKAMLSNTGLKTNEKLSNALGTLKDFTESSAKLTDLIDLQDISIEMKESDYGISGYEQYLRGFIGNAPLKERIKKNTFIYELSLLNS